eukprot:gene26665-33279_t
MTAAALAEVDVFSGSRLCISDELKDIYATKDDKNEPIDFIRYLPAQYVKIWRIFPESGMMDAGREYCASDQVPIHTRSCTSDELKAMEKDIRNSVQRQFDCGLISDLELCTSDELNAMEKDIRNSVQDSLTTA